jgi:two-component system, OmpR family, phosphate regulon response regulator PhoB
MARLLVIEDEKALQKVLAHNLKQAGHEVFVAATGAAGIALAQSEKPDLVLLDLMLPDMSGTEVAKTLKRGSATERIAIVIVSARAEELDRIVGFELGASDYVVKPFSVRELVLRVQAVLRRPEVAGRERSLEVGALRIDVEAHRLWVDQREVELTLLEFKLLLSLCQNRERVLTRAALLVSVWGMDVSVTTRTVDTHMKRLRDKLGSAAEHIETVRGVGYRLTASPATPAAAQRR